MNQWPPQKGDPNWHSQDPWQSSQGDYGRPQSNAFPQQPGSRPAQPGDYPPFQPQYQLPPQSARRKPDKRTVTVQSGSNGFHLFMTVITGGAWLIIWPLFRRKVRVTTKYH